MTTRIRSRGNVGVAEVVEAHAPEGIADAGSARGIRNPGLMAEKENRR
jgi:hypothetical protein